MHVDDGDLGHVIVIIKNPKTKKKKTTFEPKILLIRVYLKSGRSRMLKIKHNMGAADGHFYTLAVIRDARRS